MRGVRHGVRLRIAEIAALAFLASLLAPMMAAHAAQTLVTASTSGPTMGSTEVTATATCDGQDVTGGGVNLTATGGNINGMHVNGTEPGDGSGTELTGYTADPDSWLAMGGAGGMPPTGAAPRASPSAPRTRPTSRLLRSRRRRWPALR
ncbi:MAG: hypothetical protein ACRDJU_15335 [Actinomycetota bacterium]